MMKIRALYLGIFLSLMAISNSYADFEALETVMSRVENVQKEAQNVQEEIKKVQAVINEIRQGGLGILKDMAMGIANTAVGMATSMANGLVSGVIPSSILPKGMAENTKDLTKLQANIEKTMVPQSGNNEAYSETKKATEALKREHLSRFYAFAFTTRTNIAKEAREKGEDDKPKEMKDSREMVQAINDEALESAERLNLILDMQLSVDEFAMINLLQGFSVEEDDEENGGTK